MPRPSNRSAARKPALPAPILLPHGPSRESMIAAERELDAPARPAA